MSEEKLASHVAFAQKVIAEQKNWNSVFSTKMLVSLCESKSDSCLCAGVTLNCASCSSESQRFCARCNERAAAKSRCGGGSGCLGRAALNTRLAATNVSAKNSALFTLDSLCNLCAEKLAAELHETPKLSEEQQKALLEALCKKCKETAEISYKILKAQSGFVNFQNDWILQHIETLRKRGATRRATFEKKVAALRAQRRFIRSHRKSPYCLKAANDPEIRKLLRKRGAFRKTCECSRIDQIECSHPVCHICRDGKEDSETQVVESIRMEKKLEKIEEELEKQTIFDSELLRKIFVAL